jgi:hypothetical protein
MASSSIAAAPEVKAPEQKHLSVLKSFQFHKNGWVLVSLEGASADSTVRVNLHMAMSLTTDITYTEANVAVHVITLRYPIMVGSELATVVFVTQDEQLAKSFKAEVENLMG